MTDSASIGLETRPNFLIVGAARSGTTSLYHWLKSHPEVFMPEEKEPGYFLHDFGISNLDQYLSLFEPGRGKKAIGESSVQYFDAPESPRWIHDILGDIKIIILLRNPVERAYSLYSLAVMDGSEWISSFQEALSQEEKRSNDPFFLRKKLPHYFRHYMYFDGGLYFNRVKKYVDIFGTNRVKIHLFEDLAGAPSKFCSEICNFLEISSEFQAEFVRHNKAAIPRFVKLQYCLNKVNEACLRMPRVFRPKILQAVSFVRNLNINAGYRAELPLVIRESLQKKYRNDIVRLGELIGRDLSAWLP